MQYNVKYNTPHTSEKQTEESRKRKQGEIDRQQNKNFLKWQNKAL